ncbi:hypothetical protein Daesc_007961 [Daldinia eschscholtzii]|uniref:Uncharacterized protein n=1 Tax=Daldinia eschscholtzii TaxID=292717 RepID=A0AAX6MG46_9PEZI
MLGRLGMTIEDCIDAYRRLAKKAFTPKRRLSPLPLPPTGAYSAKALEKAIKEVVKTECKDETCSTWDSCPHENALFRSDACVKTCGRDDIEFIDAAFGYNNPCEVLIEEAQKQFPEARQLHILSIGTGLGAIVTIKDSRVSILKALKSISTTSKKVADRLDEKYGTTGQYYRFNVDRGLEDVTLADWEKASKISAHTHNYLLEKQRDIIRCAKAYSSASRAVDGDASDQQQQRDSLRSHVVDEAGWDNQEALDYGQSILRNIVLRDSEQRNAITGLGIRSRARISDNTCSGGSKQWNSVRA